MECNKIESGVQLFSRIRRKSSLEDGNINPHLFPESGPFPNNVIEITGDSKIDKNDLLIDFIVKCILPKKYNKGWKGCGAILINTEFQINLLKIIKVIDTFLIKYNISDSKKDIIENALKNLTIFNCYSLEEFKITFYYLEKIVQYNKDISLLVVDNIAAHFWVASMHSDMLSYYHHSLKMFEMLYDIIKGLQLLLIFVRHEGTPNKKRFNKRVDFRIELEKTSENYTANVTDYEKQSVTNVPFQINTVLQFS